MNPDKTVEYNSLSWVKAQLDDVLSDAQSNLSEYIEDKDVAHLENCIEHLQLIYGTLQMVEVYGASMLAEEMQLTTTALLEGEIERAEDAYDVLMRAMLQLPDYLEGIQSGKKDAPITLMPLINDLRAARKEGLLSEGVLFSPDVENVELATDGYDASAIEPGKLQGEVKRLRTHYQLGLLDFLRNKKERVGLQRIKAVLNSLEKVSSDVQVRHIWMVFGALVEGLMKQGIDNSLSIKMLLGTVDRQLKLILDIGEEEFSKQYSKEIVKNGLYYVGLCTIDSKAIAAVKKAYQLSDLIPQESDETSTSIGGLNADLFDTVSKGISEDLAKVKDVLELFMFSNKREIEQLVPVAEQLGKIADTYGMLSMGATRQAIMDQRAVLESIISGDTEINEESVSGIAFELLSAESELKDFIAERSGFVDMNRDSDDRTVPAAEYREVVFTVVGEGLKNFSEAKEAILAYVSEAGDGIDGKAQLDIVLNRLEEVRGVSMMLPLGRVESQIAKLQNYIRTALLNNNHKVGEEEQDTVADVVTSIEYFFEALAEGRPGVEQGLNAGDEAADKLESIAESYGVSKVQSVVSDESEGGFVEDSGAVSEVAEIEIEAEIDAEKEEQVIAKTEVVIPDSAATEQSDELRKIEQYAILADDADEEIVEIFIEEAVEVLGELHTYLPQWKENSDDEEALAVVRRSFHTLKGSGRLLGADLIGEFAWKFENILNRVIDNKINITDGLHNALDEALAVLPQLIEQLKGNREPIDNIAELMLSADAISEGREVSFELPAEVEEIIVERVSDVSEAVVDESEVYELEVDELEVDELEVDAAKTEDVIDIESTGDDELPVSDDIDSDMLVADGSGLDIAELDSEEDVSAEEGMEIDIDDVSTDSSLDEEIEVTDSLDDAVDVVTDIVAESNELLEEGIDEVITLDADKVIEDDISIDVESLNAEPIGDDDVVVEVMPEGLTDNDELIDLSGSTDIEDEYVVVIDEGGVDSEAGETLDIDPMLLKIYHDESQSHAEVIRQLVAKSEGDSRPLKADKDLMRAFHTLYGSARTAEVEPIADLTGAAEKYVKARQESREDDIPDDVVAVIVEIEQSVSEMLSAVNDGQMPAVNKPLQDKINKIVQQEIQRQLQQSWQDNSVDEEAGTARDLSADAAEDADELDASDEISIDISDLSADVQDDVIDEVEIPEDQVIETQEDEVQSVIEEPAIVPYGDIDDELIDIFLEEAEELLESCENTLAEIKDTPNSVEHIQQFQRNMHTLKGGARMADLTPIGDLTHNLESLVVKISENKVKADKVTFDLLQESLDRVTVLLASVKKREPLLPASDLNSRIEMLMRGEIAEKRAVERFDVELSDLESEGDEELEQLDVSSLFSGAQDEDKGVQSTSIVTSEADTVEISIKDKAKGRSTDSDRAHWGERASDVNFRESQEQVRVRSDLLNNLVNYAGEVNIYHARMGKQITDFGFNLSELTQTVDRLKNQLRNLEIETEIQIRSGYEKEADNFDDNFDPLEMDQYSTLQQLTRSLSETAGDVESINEILADITRDSETLLVQESRVSTDLQEGLMRTRMVRFGGLSSRLRRVVRQVSREMGKEVEVEIKGDESEVDRTVLDRIIAPLEHMLRNAVAHGIEVSAARIAQGKNEVGKISIEVGRDGTDVIIDVKDDGAGIDVEKIRQKAVKQGFMKADAELSDHDALQFVLQSGFSTADVVTQVAGRGVGMDVVDSEIKQLGGVLVIETVQGKGTTFHIRLPLTLAINQALLVRTADDIYAVPLASIEGVVRITGLELQRFYDSENSYYEFNGVEYELKHLGAMLTGHQSDYSKQLQLFPVLLVHVGDQHFALHVDDLIGRREIVVKPVGMQIGAVRGIAGATILADGRVVLILEMSALVVADSLFKEHVPVEEAVVVSDKTTVMVVDDSITIRKVTERMLSRYGIEVVLAKDGVDATNQLQDFMPDLMLLDIEMPRMDGFEVASYVRNDERFKDLPIIMITSRTGSKHKEKAMEIGVNQYLGKPFQEDDLVSNINKILNTSF
ncbi:MAG: response regulator [Gammaproteobacteria bacterium]|nr:response regulator [Gammaproteobacteria bacterium]